MIPYWTFPSIHLVGPLSLHVFGALVAIGILVGARVTMRRADQLGVPKEDLSNAIFWAVLIGFVFAHWFDLFTYQEGSLFHSQGAVLAKLNPRRLLDPFDGISSMGGFLGALVTLLVFARRKHQSILAYCDSLAFGLAPGWTFGRLGCFSAHDHPGVLTHFFLGVKFPGGTRHDLGFEEALFALALTIAFFLLARRKRPAGFYVAVFALFYGPVRFGLDFLRIRTGAGADPRYFGLTPAQYASIPIFLTGVVLAVVVARRARDRKKGASSAASAEAAGDKKATKSDPEPSQA